MSKNGCFSSEIINSLSTYGTTERKLQHSKNQSINQYKSTSIAANALVSRAHRRHHQKER